MTRQSSEDASSFCENVLSSIPECFEVLASYFIDGNSIEPESAFDYKIIVVSPFVLDVPFPLYPISGAKELSFLECLLLREVIKHIDSLDSFLLGARFGTRVNRGSNGKILSSLEILSLQDESFLNHLLKNLGAASPQYPLYDERLPIRGPSTAQGILKSIAEIARTEEIPDDALLLAVLNLFLLLVILSEGLGKLLTIPELDPGISRQDIPLTKEDVSRIQLIRAVTQPPYNTRPIKDKDPHSIAAHWAKVPGRLFVYGPILDLVNVFREKRIVKVCWNCGELYRPYQSEYHKEAQHYCSDTCRKRAERKRRYQLDKKTQRKTGG